MVRVGVDYSLHFVRGATGSLSLGQSSLQRHKVHASQGALVVVVAAHILEAVLRHVARQLALELVNLAVLFGQDGLHAGHLSREFGDAALVVIAVAAAAAAVFLAVEAARQRQGGALLWCVEK